jgi:hypothetical protein
MNYTDKEIELIKIRAYDKGTRDGCYSTIILCIIVLIVSSVL